MLRSKFSYKVAITRTIYSKDKLKFRRQIEENIISYIKKVNIITNRDFVLFGNDLLPCKYTIAEEISINDMVNIYEGIYEKELFVLDTPEMKECTPRISLNCYQNANVISYEFQFEMEFPICECYKSRNEFCTCPLEGYFCKQHMLCYPKCQNKKKQMFSYYINTSETIKYVFNNVFNFHVDPMENYVFHRKFHQTINIAQKNNFDFENALVAPKLDGTRILGNIANMSLLIPSEQIHREINSRFMFSYLCVFEKIGIRFFLIDVPNMVYENERHEIGPKFAVSLIQQWDSADMFKFKSELKSETLSNEMKPSFRDRKMRDLENTSLSSFSPEQNIGLSSFSPEQNTGLSSFSPEQNTGLSPFSPEQNTSLTSFSPGQNISLTSFSPEQNTGLSPFSPGQNTSLTSVSLEQSISVSPFSPEQNTGLSPFSPEQSTSLTSVSPEQNTGLSPFSPEQNTSLTSVSPEQNTGLTSVSPEQSTSLSPFSPEQSTSLTPFSPEQSTSLSPFSPEQSTGLTSVSPEQSTGLVIEYNKFFHDLEIAKQWSEISGIPNDGFLYIDDTSITKDKTLTTIDLSLFLKDFFLNMSQKTGNVRKHLESEKKQIPKKEFKKLLQTENLKTIILAVLKTKEGNFLSNLVHEWNIVDENFPKPEEIFSWFFEYENLISNSYVVLEFSFNTYDHTFKFFKKREKKSANKTSDILSILGLE